MGSLAALVASITQWPRLVAVAIASLTTISVTTPEVLANTTPSEPLGLYVRTHQKPKIGRLIAFHAPPAAFPYADTKLGYLRKVPLLKSIAAGEGDLVCTTSGRLTINGSDRAPIARIDSEGKRLPRWRGCRQLRAAEFFVFSDRVPNSFDSRYFGPIRGQGVIGVYKALLTAQEAR